MMECVVSIQDDVVTVALRSITLHCVTMYTIDSYMKINKYFLLLFLYYLLKNYEIIVNKYHNQIHLDNSYETDVILSKNRNSRHVFLSIHLLSLSVALDFCSALRQLTDTHLCISTIGSFIFGIITAPHFALRLVHLQTAQSITRACVTVA